MKIQQIQQIFFNRKTDFIFKVLRNEDYNINQIIELCVRENEKD